MNALLDYEKTVPLTQRSRLRWLVYLPVVSALLVGALLRSQSLTESLWLDELHTAWVATGEFHELIDRAQIGNQSPFYPALVWLTTRTLGANEYGVRLLSWAAGVALIVTCFLLLDRWCNAPLLGGLAAWLVAIDPHSIYFSQEARPYAWVQWFGVLQLAAFVAVLENPTRRRRGAWIATTIILFYLHYTSLLILAGEAVCWLTLLVIRPQLRKGVSATLVDVSLVLLATMPAWGHLWAISGRRDNWTVFVHAPNWWNVVMVFRLDIWIGVPLVILVLLWGGLRLIGWQIWNADSFARGKLTLVSCCFCVPLLTAWALTEFDLFRVFFRRYLMVIAGLPMIAAGLLGTGVTQLSVRLGYSMMVAIFATCWLLPLSSFSIHGVPHYHTMEDWRGAISFVNQQDRRDWPVFLRAGLIEDRDLRTEQATDQLKQYCLFPLQTIYPLAVADEQLFALPSQQSWEITANEIEAIEEAGGAWVFVRGAAATAELIGARWVEWLTPRSKSSLTVKRHEFGLLSVLELNAVND